MFAIPVRHFFKILAFRLVEGLRLLADAGAAPSVLHRSPGRNERGFLAG